MSEPIPKAIATALAAAQRAVKNAAHDAENAHHRYRYTSAEAIIEASHDALDPCGLALVQCGWSIATPLDPAAPYRIETAYLLAHESGESWALPLITTPVIIEKGRPADKAEAAALTYALAYTLRGLLRMPRHEGASVDARNDTGYEPPASEDSRAVAAPIVDALLSASNALEYQTARARLVEAWPRISDPEVRAECTAIAKAAQERVNAR